MSHKVLWILLLIFLIQMQKTEQKSFHRRHNNGKKSSAHTASKHSRPFLRRKTTALVEESQPSLYAFNKPFGFMESKYQSLGRINQPAVKTDEIYAEDISLKKPQLIKDITLKNDASFSSALENELTIRKLLDEIVAKSRLLSTEGIKEEALTAMETENLNKLKSNENSSVKVELDNALKNFENQTINPNDNSKDVLKKTETISVNETVTKELKDIANETVNKELVTQIAKNTTKPAQAIDRKKQILLEEMFKKAIMQHYWQQILKRAKDMEKGDKTVSSTKKKELSKLVKESSKNFEDLVEISVSTDKNTWEGDSATPIENPNFVEITSGKEENSKQNNNLTEILDNIPSNSDLTKNFTPENQNLTTADIDFPTKQEDNIDGDDLLIATIDDDDNKLSNTDLINDIQDRSNAIIRILHKDDLQKTDVFRNTNDESPFNLTTVTSEPHPEEIVAMLLDDETLKNQLDFLQQNAPKIKKHKEVLSDKINLLDNGVLTKNDTELEADFRKAVQEQLHKMGQNIKTVIDFSKLFANISTVDSAEEPLRQTNLYNEEQTLELPQYIQFYGEEIDIPESITQPQTLTKPAVSIDHMQAMKFEPIVEVPHGNNFTTTESSAEIKPEFEEVTPPSNSVISEEITKTVTEKTEETTALPAKEVFAAIEISNASAITDKPLTGVINSVEKLAETLEKETEETILLMNSNQSLNANSNDLLKKETILLPSAQQIKEEDTKDGGTTETTTIIQTDYLYQEKIDETTEYSQVKEDISPSKSVTEKLTEEDYNSAIESQTTSLVVDNSGEGNTAESEHEIVDQEKVANFKAKENSTVFKDNPTTLTQGLKAQDVEETTVYHPSVIFETSTEKAIEKPQNDSSEVPIINLIKDDNITESPIFKAEEFSDGSTNENLNTGLSELLDASKVAIKDTFPEEHSTEKNLGYAHEFVGATTAAFGTKAEYIEDAAVLETTTVRSQLPKLEDQSLMNGTISEHKLSMTANIMDVDIQVNTARTEILKKEDSIKQDTKENTSEISQLQQKDSEKFDGYEENETRKDYTELEPIKGQSGNIVREWNVNSTETHKKNVESNANLSVVVKELVKTGTKTAQVEMNENLSTTSNVEILKEPIEKEESKDTTKVNITEKLPEEVKAPAEAESTLQDNKKILTIGSDNLKTGEIEGSKIAGNYSLIEANLANTASVTNENFESDKVKNTSVIDSEKLRETNAEELQTVNNNQENEEKMEEAITVENNEVKKEATVILTNRDEENEEDMKQTTVVNNDWVKDETVNEMSAEHNEEIADEYREESAGDYDEETEENTEGSLEIEYANAEDEIIQETTPKNGIIKEQIEESITVANDKEKEEIIVQPPVIYDDYITEDLKEDTSTKDKSPDMILGTSIENSNKIKDELISESLISGSDKIKEEMLIDLSAEDIDKLREDMIEEISAESNDSIKNESLTADSNGNKGLVDEIITVATENSNVKEENNESLKYENKASTEDSDKAEAEISDKETFTGKEPIKIQIIKEMSAESNGDSKEEKFEDFSAVAKGEAQNKIKENISEETESNDEIKGEKNKEEMNKLVNEEEKWEQVKTEDVTEVTRKEVATENSADMLKNKVKIEYIDDASEKENDESVDKSKDELKENKKVHFEIKTKDDAVVDGDKMKVEIIEETTTEEDNVKLEEMTEDSTEKFDKKLSDRREPTAKDAEKEQQEIIDLSSNEKTQIQEELSAVSSDKIKANDAEDKWKIKQEATKVPVTVEQNKVKEEENKTRPNLKKQNQKRRRWPVIKSNIEEIANNKTWNNAETIVEVEDDASNQKHEEILDEKRPIAENKTSSESLLVKANIGETYVKEIETVKVDKEKLKRIELNIAEKNNTRSDAEKMNESSNELRIILSSANNADTVKKTGLETLNKDGEFEEITETTLTETDGDNVKYDKGVLKQIELNVAKKQNEKETQQNVTDEGNNQLRIIVTKKEDLDANINQHQDMENKSDSRKRLVTMTTNTKASTHAENEQFIRKVENNTAPPKWHVESLTTTETNKTSDDKNIKKKNQQQKNDKNNSIEIQKLNEDVSSTVNCVTTAVEGPAAGAGATAVDSMKIDDADKNNQENSKRLEDIKTRAIKRIGIVMPKQHVEVENNKSIESELNDENNEVAAAAAATAVAVEDDDSDSVDVNDFTDDEMTTLKPVSLTWQQEDNSSMYHQSTKDEDEEDEEEQQALESDEVDSYVDDDDDTAAQNDVNDKDSQNEDKVGDMKNVSFTDKNQVFENNINAEEQQIKKHDNLVESKNDDETNQETDTFEDNKENIATIATVAKLIDDNTMDIVKNHGNRKIPEKNQIPTADAAVVVVTDDDETHRNAADDDTVDYDAGDAIGFADTTQYHANKRVQNIEALGEQQSPLSNWWSTLHHAEIRKFLNSIFNDEFYQEIARQAGEELKEIPQRHHGVLKHNRRKGSTSQWLSNVWSFW